MCSRFYIKKDFKEKLAALAAEEGILIPAAAARLPGGELDVHPTEAALAIAAGGVAGGTVSVAGEAAGNAALTLSEMCWGFTAPSGQGLLINARAETAGEKYSFADSLMKRRCVIPASGFYEWDANKARYRFFAPEEELLLLAGIYREEPGGGRFTILTTDANASMAPVHDRMPLMIAADELKAWICDGSETDRFLKRGQAELVRELDAVQIGMDLGI